ncbi:MULTISPECIES: NCS1 family nucleobase:cation symporter-1 [unclassified Iodidimonas]|jgi:NCS1 family nucleobase:cation symporter-1|uniref:NCS1 family nucleobase:cation symporter-1 n=1 Tax=unclassified Iodidimonas TaxID=2626145 RepID=UPI0024831662|nr:MULTISPECIES: NCS1 family nucleobase:cation symporter-1 [unclassified Iodidimonas]
MHDTSKAPHPQDGRQSGDAAHGHDQAHDRALWNADLAPTPLSERTWDWKAFASLWVAMVVCVPAYLLSGSLVSEGMNWWQAVLTVFLGNLIVLIPMMLVGHAGAKHGVPFPVLLRSSFGTVGARLPALLRGLVACGWFGINTWVGGSAIYVILNTLSGQALAGRPLPFLGIDLAQSLSFLAFWALHVWFVRHGTESIRWLEMLAAPFLILTSFSLLIWAWVEVGSLGAMLSNNSQFAPGGAREGQFWPVFFASLTAMVGFWSTMALNIPDFTRFAKSQRHQIIGQALGLPIPMALFAFISVAVTSATLVIYGEAIWDPVKLAARMGGFGVVVALGALVIATLTTNLAANVVAPAYGFSNLAPGRISFRMGGYITAGIGIAMFPWKLMESAGTYLFTWLVGYSALLGPIVGILIVDYFLIRRTELVVDDLFSNDGRYSRKGGWNKIALLALILGALPSLPGFLHATRILGSVPPIFDSIYSYAWFVGVGVAGGVYWIFSRKNKGEASCRS